MLPVVFSTMIGKAHRTGQDSNLDKCLPTWLLVVKLHRNVAFSTIIGEAHRTGQDSNLDKCLPTWLLVVKLHQNVASYNDW
jgi:hypothetical protein